MASEEMSQEAATGAEAKANPAPTEGSEGAAGIDFVLDVPVKLTVEVGSARLLVRDVLQVNRGSVVELDRMSGDPADILVNGRLVARGEITVVDERLAVKIVEVMDRDPLGEGSG